MAPHQRGLRNVVSEAMKGCRSAFSSAFVFSFLINLLMLTGPLFMLQVYDRVLTSKSIPTLMALFLLVAVLFIFMGVFDFFRARVMNRIGAQFEMTLRDVAFDSTVAQAAGRKAGVSQPVRDVETIRQFISAGGPSAFFDMPWVPFYLAINFVFHWIIGVVSVIGAVILFFLAVLSEFMTRKPVEEATQSNLKAHRMLDEGRRNAEVLRSMGMLSNYRDRWGAVHTDAQASGMRLHDRISAITASSKAMRLFLQSAILAVGAALAVQNEISPGMMIAASIIMSRALAPVEQALGQWRNFRSARTAYANLKDFLADANDGDEPMPLQPPQGRLTVEDLLVMHDRDTTALRGIKFDLPPGSGLGVIGATGSGKTTLARTLVGVLQPLKGKVRLDGAALDQWPEHQLERYIGYLPQNVELFTGTIAENICRFSPDPDPDEVVAAAKLADVHEMILKMPEGYNTNIGEAGSALSAGQRQRIALARAAYRKPVLVILDEPNSNLDAVGERALRKAMIELRASGSTVVIIAHRPGAVAEIDTLLFLTDGMMDLFGPREKVLAELSRRHKDGGPPPGTPPRPASPPSGTGPKPLALDPSSTDDNADNAGQAPKSRAARRRQRKKSLALDAENQIGSTSASFTDKKPADQNVSTSDTPDDGASSPDAPKPKPEDKT